MAFLLKSNQETAPVLRKVVLMNSLTFTVGDYVKGYVDGAASNASTAGVAGLGVIHAFVLKNGMPVAETLPVAGTAGTAAATAVTTGSDNTTTELYWALVDVSQNSVYSAAVSGTIGTTVNSDQIGARVDTNSAGGAGHYGEVLETTATRTLATDANWYIWGIDPEDSTRLLVSMAYSERSISTP
jgi:hypothetical protein